MTGNKNSESGGTLSKVNDISKKHQTGKAEKKALKNQRLKKYAGTGMLLFACIILLTITTHNANAAPLDTVETLIEGDSGALQIIATLTLITLVPSLLIMLSGFTRIVIVLSIVRNAIGLQNMPPNTVIIGLALFITYFVMSPVISEVNEVAYEPYSQGQIELEEFTSSAMGPIREFMFEQTYETDLDFFSSLADIEEAQELNDIPNRVVIAAFVTSELKHAFAIGFFIYIPFIVIDMVVASTLMAMGMMMLPPAMISMPFKILLFVLVDGWQLTIGTLINSFGG